MEYLNSLMLWTIANTNRLLLRSLTQRWRNERSIMMVRRVFLLWNILRIPLNWERLLTPFILVSSCKEQHIKVLTSERPRHLRTIWMRPEGSISKGELIWKISLFISFKLRECWDRSSEIEQVERVVDCIWNLDASRHWRDWVCSHR